MLKDEFPFAGFLLIVGCIVFICLCPIVGVPAFVTWFVCNNKNRIRILFCEPNGGISIVKTEELCEMKQELEENEDFVDPVAENYKKEVESLLKPGFQDNPEWQKGTEKLRKHVEENRKKAEAEEKEDLEREKRENNGYTEDIKQKVDEKVQKAHAQWVTGYF